MNGVQRVEAATFEGLAEPIEQFRKENPEYCDWNAEQIGDRWIALCLPAPYCPKHGKPAPRVPARRTTFPEPTSTERRWMPAAEPAPMEARTNAALLRAIRELTGEVRALRTEVDRISGRVSIDDVHHDFIGRLS